MGDAKPFFAKLTQEAELWPMLLEKVFAKFCGSYATLETGDPLWAWQAVTGSNDAFTYNKTGDDTWKESKLKVSKQRTDMQDGKRRAMPMFDTGKTFSNDDMWQNLV